MKPLVLPQVNLNGSPRERLVEQQCDVMHALDVLQKAMQEAAPNGRDYQFRPEEFRPAHEAWIERMRMLDAMYKEIEAHAIAIQDFLMDELYLRKIEHPQARDNYRVILKSDGDETEVGSIGIQHFTSTDTAWVWGIDTVIPMRQHQTEGRGDDRRDCMRKFKAAWQALTSDRGWFLEFMEAKRRSRR